MNPETTSVPLMSQEGGNALERGPELIDSAELARVGVCPSLGFATIPEAGPRRQNGFRAFASDDMSGSSGDRHDWKHGWRESDTRLIFPPASYLNA